MELDGAVGAVGPDFASEAEAEAAARAARQAARLTTLQRAAASSADIDTPFGASRYASTTFRAKAPARTADTLPATQLLDASIQIAGPQAAARHPDSQSSGTEQRAQTLTAPQPDPADDADGAETAGVQSAPLGPDRASIRVRIIGALEQIVPMVTQVLRRLSIPSTGGPAVVTLALGLGAMAGLGLWLRGASRRPH
jgi:hypothetical protein